MQEHVKCISVKSLLAEGNNIRSYLLTSWDVSSRKVAMSASRCIVIFFV